MKQFSVSERILFIIFFVFLVDYRAMNKIEGDRKQNAAGKKFREALLRLLALLFMHTIKLSEMQFDFQSFV